VAKPGKRLAAGLCALAVLAAAVAWLGVRLWGDHAGAGPRQAAVAYFQAVAAGDAEAALALAWDEPADLAFLTDSALAAALAGHPITSVTAGAVNAAGERTWVEVAYDLGGDHVVAYVPLTERGGVWRLEHAAATLATTPLGAGTAGLTIDGAEVADSAVYLFPGVYRLGTANPLYAFSRTELTVQEPSDWATFGGELTLSEAGQAALREATEDWLDHCLEPGVLNPEGCGFHINVPDGGIVESTLAWTVTTPLGGTGFALDADNLAHATASPTFIIHGEVDAADEQGKYYTIDLMLSLVTADLSDPDNIGIDLVWY
jgi:hypothetical protein